MRVLQVVHGFPPRESAGAETSISSDMIFVAVKLLTTTGSTRGIVALPFSVYDISETLTKIHLLLLGEADDGEEEDSG